MYLTMSPRIRRSPFYEATVRDGVTHFTVYNKMLMPISFGNLEAELPPVSVLAARAESAENK